MSKPKEKPYLQYSLPMLAIEEPITHKTPLRVDRIVGEIALSPERARELFIPGKPFPFRFHILNYWVGRAGTFDDTFVVRSEDGVERVREPRTFQIQDALNGCLVPREFTVHTDRPVLLFFEVLLDGELVLKYPMRIRVKARQEV